MPLNRSENVRPFVSPGMQDSGGRDGNGVSPTPAVVGSPTLEVFAKERTVTPSSVLLVEDSAAQRNRVRRALESTPEFRVIAEALTGAQAVARAREYQPDIILLDLHMPVKPGLAALPDLILASPRSSVIVLSDHDTSQAESAVLEGGGGGFIPNAGDLSGLPAAIADALHRPKPAATSSALRILVVGYDSQTRLAVTDGLAWEMSAVVVHAAGGDDALQQLRANRFDLIVCGNRMEDMGGAAFLEQSLAVARGTPRIMFAQSKDPSVEARAREAGAELFVPRGTFAPEQSIQELAQKMRRLLYALSLTPARGPYPSARRKKATVLGD